MKKIISFTLACILLALCCCMTACSTPAMKKEEGGFRHPKTDVYYRRAPLSYYGRTATDEAYARIKAENIDDILLYPIEGVDPDRFLVTEDGTLYYSGEEKLPNLGELPCARVGIYDTQVGSGEGTVTDEASISALKALYNSDVWCAKNDMPFLWSEYTSYDLRFFGDGAYEGIYFRLWYLVFTEDVIITVLIEDADTFEDAYPGVPYETMWDTYGDEEYYVAKYNFGREILMDMSSGKCHKMETSLLSYLSN